MRVGSAPCDLALAVEDEEEKRRRGGKVCDKIEPLTWQGKKWEKVK